MNIAPDTNIIEANRKAALSWSIILGELIDNAFDADAKQVRISFDGAHLEVEDDGCGCDDLRLFFTMGKRQGKGTTKLGRYGVGAKDAIISAGNAVTVISTCKGITRRAQCDWQKVEKSGTWEIENPTEVQTGNPSGTKISIDRLRSDRIHRFDELSSSLSLAYTPAIRAGRQILLKKSAKSKAEAVSEYKLPAFPDGESKTAELEINGKKARVQIGLTPEGSRIRQMGLIIAFGFRVISSGVRIGLGDQPTPGLFGWVDLLEGWQISKNKTEIIDLHELEPAIAEAFKDIIAKAVKRSNSIPLKDLENRFNKLLNQFADENKRKRKAVRASAENQSGTVLPIESGRKHSRASRSQPGNTFNESSGHSSGIKFSWVSLGADGPSHRIETSQYGNILYLNQDNLTISRDKSDNRKLALHVIYGIVPHLALWSGDLFSPTDEGKKTTGEKIAILSGKFLSAIDDDGLIGLSTEEASAKSA